MLRKIDSFLLSKPSYVIALFSLSLIAIIGMIDHATGYELSFSIFYTIPVSIGVWYLGKRFGNFVSILSATTWMAVEYFSGNQYSHPTVLLWNTAVRLGYFVLTTSLLSHIRALHDVQEMLAQKDGLTELMNTRTFKQRCDSVFALASRHGRPLALGYLDLDGFKSVNDSFGHEVGDQILMAIATAMAKRLRTSDIGGRLGGDEFAILLPETDLVGARKFFTLLHEELVSLAATNHWPVGFSIGVAVCQRPTANSDDAIAFADGLMYKVKKSGKNNILFEECP